MTHPGGRHEKTDPCPIRYRSGQDYWSIRESRSVSTAAGTARPLLKIRWGVPRMECSWPNALLRSMAAVSHCAFAGTTPWAIQVTYVSLLFFEHQIFWLFSLDPVQWKCSGLLRSFVPARRARARKITRMKPKGSRLPPPHHGAGGGAGLLRARLQPGHGRALLAHDGHRLPADRAGHGCTGHRHRFTPGGGRDAGEQGYVRGVASRRGRPRFQPG